MSVASGRTAERATRKTSHGALRGPGPVVSFPRGCPAAQELPGQPIATTDNRHLPGTKIAAAGRIVVQRCPGALRVRAVDAATSGLPIFQATGSTVCRQSVRLPLIQASACLPLGCYWPWRHLCRYWRNSCRPGREARV